MLWVKFQQENKRQVRFQHKKIWVTPFTQNGYNDYFWNMNVILGTFLTIVIHPKSDKLCKLLMTASRRK